MRPPSVIQSPTAGDFAGRGTMPMPSFQSSDAIREHFSAALSDMYRREVPLYGSLLDIVAAVNRDALAAQPDVADVERDRLESERHGAIRLGTAAELFTMRRIFVVMGMQPVGLLRFVFGGRARPCDGISPGPSRGAGAQPVPCLHFASAPRPDRRCGDADDRRLYPADAPDILR